MVVFVTELLMIPKFNFVVNIELVLCMGLFVDFFFSFISFFFPSTKEKNF